MFFDCRQPHGRWRGLLLAAHLLLASLASVASAVTSTELYIDGSRYQALLEPSPARIGMSDADRQQLRGTHYSGSLAQVPESWVRLSHLAGNWSGVVSLHGQMHIIDSQTFAQQNHVPIARSLESLDAPGTCGVGDGSHSSLELPVMEGASPRSGRYEIAAATVDELCTNKVDGVCLLPEKYLIVDHLFQQKYPDTYQDKVVELLNIIDGFYRNDMNMVFDNLHVEFPSEELLLASTSANELLVNLRDKYHTFPFADTSTSSPLIELLSGREFDGSTVGLAYVGTICNPNGYATGVTQEYVNIPITAIVMAHEIGHNFGANHDNVESDITENPERYCGNGYIMSSWADASATGFSSCSVTQMTAKVDSLSNHDACFNYPVDAGIDADPGNPSQFDDLTGNQLELVFPLTHRQASRTADQWTLNGTVSNGSVSSAQLPGGSCAVNADQRGFQCTLAAPFTDHALSLTAHSDNSQSVVITQAIQVTGDHIKDIVTANNTLATTLTVNITSNQPGDLIATGQESPLQVQLSWTDQAHGETGYLIERQIEGQSWQPLGTQPAGSTSYTDTSISYDTTYFYRVTAEGNGISGTHSNIDSVRIDGMPATPSGLQASLSESGIELAWLDNASNEIAYRVDRQRQDGTSWTTWTTLSDSLPSNSQAFSDTTAVPGETYQYRVFALNETLISASSNIAQVVYQTLPATPSNLTALQNGNEIQLNWNHDSDNTHTVIVERQLDNDGWQTLATLGNVSSHTDASLQPGREHQYRVISRNNQGDSAPSNSASVLVSELPAAPSNLTAQLDGTYVNLAWTNNASNADSLIVQRQIDGGSWADIATLAADAATYVDTATQVGSHHAYQVIARNSIGDSAASNQASLLVDTVPAAPTNLTAQLDGTSVNLAWTNNASNADSLIVQRQIDGGTWADIATLAGDAATYVDTATQVGSHHGYQVIGRNSIGDSAASNQATLLVDDVPAAPSNLTAQLEGTSVNLAWTNNASNADNLIVQRQIGSGGWNDIATLEGGAVSHSDNATQLGNTHSYRVLARNAIGSSGTSNEAILLVDVLPTAPTSLNAQLDATQVSLSWNNQADNADQIRIERQLDSGPWQPLASLAANASSYTDQATQYGSQHSYRVIAVNTLGESPPSNTAQVLVLQPPSPPTGLQAQSNHSTAQLRWDANNSPHVSALRLERQRLGDAWQPVATLAAAADRYTDEGLNEGSYRYRLIAINPAGESSASVSEEVVIVLPPAAPTDFQAQPQNRSVVLLWTDNADNEFGFRIERQERDGETWLSWQAVAELNADVTRYTDNHVTPGSSYRYRIRSLNSAGTSTPTAALTVSLDNEQTPTGDDTSDDSLPGDFGNAGGSVSILVALLGILGLRRRRGASPC